MTGEIAAIALLLSAAIAAALQWRRRRALVPAARTYLRGKRCAICDAAFHDESLARHPAALLGTDGSIVEWSALSADQVKVAVATRVPICWNCHLAEEFRRMYPQLVTDRPPHASLFR